MHRLSQRAPLKVAEFEPVFAPLAGRATYAEWKFGFLPPGLVLPGNPQLAGTIAPITKPFPAKPAATQPETTGGAVNPPAPPTPLAPEAAGRKASRR